MGIGTIKSSMEGYMPFSKWEDAYDERERLREMICQMPRCEETGSTIEQYGGDDRWYVVVYYTQTL